MRMQPRSDGSKRWVGVRAAAVAAVAAVTLVSTPAWAQRFPADEFWVPLRCKGGVIVDLFRDQSGANDERDIVGDESAPAGHRSADADHFYVRMRVDVDPAPRGSPRPFAWRVLLDTDGDNKTYEVLIAASGTGPTKGVLLYRNTTAVPDDVTDPPDEPAVATYPFEQYARSVQAAGSNFGDAPDFFLEFAIPWRDLEPLGLKPSSFVGAWLTTSSSANGFNGDFACHDGRTGTPTFSETAPDPIVLDPFVDSDGDGFTDQTERENGTDPTEADSVPIPGVRDALLLRGGAGCGAAPSLVPVGAAWLALLGAGVVRRVRRRHPRAGA